MNACLVSCMSSKECNLRHHSDDEPFIDQGSDICTVSIGSDQNFDFIRKTSGHHRKKDIPLTPEYSVLANHHSLNVIKDGCQSYLLHRVAPGSKGGVRYSLSFRKVLPQMPIDTPSLPNSTHVLNINSDIPNTTRPKKKIVLLAGDSYFARLDADKLGKGKQTVYKISKGSSKIDAVIQSLCQ